MSCTCCMHNTIDLLQYQYMHAYLNLILSNPINEESVNLITLQLRALLVFLITCGVRAAIRPIELPDSLSKCFQTFSKKHFFRNGTAEQLSLTCLQRYMWSGESFDQHLYSFIHLFIRSLIHSFIHPFTISFNHSFGSHHYLTTVHTEIKIGN